MERKNRRIIIGVLFVPVFLNFVPFSQAEVLTTADKALKKVFREAARFDREQFVLSDGQVADVEERAQIAFAGAHSAQIQMYTAKTGDQVLGFAFEDIVVGKWGPIHYLVGLDTGGTVLEVMVLDYQEIRGRPVAKGRFLRQYKKKSIHDPVRLRKDIDGVTGATISSRSLTDGVRKLLHVFDIIR